MGRNGSGVEIRQKSLRVSFTFEGRNRRHTLMLNGRPMLPTGPNIKYAQRLVAEIRDRIRHGTFSMAEYFPLAGTGGAPMTVANQLDTWLAAQRIKTSTRVGYQTAMRFWKVAIGDKALRGLKHSDILTVLAARPDLSGKTINNRTSVLKSALDLAVRDNTLTANPMTGLARATQQKPPIEPFTADESARILASVAKRYPGALANMIDFWFRTGMRTSELFALKWSSIDMTAGTALIHEARVTGVEEDSTKTGKTREVRLDPRALAALQRQKAITFMAGSHVFVDPYTSQPWSNTQAFSRRVWVPLLKLAGVTYRRPYNIRHTRATEMLMAGLKPGFSARQLGHDVAVYLTVYAKWISGADDAAEMAKMEPTRNTSGVSASSVFRSAE